MAHHHHSHCHGGAPQIQGPEVFYGYCHESGRMRMMNYPDFLQNMQTGVSNMYQGSSMQPILTAMMNLMTGTASQPQPQPGRGWGYGEHGHRHHECGCGCHKHHRECDCGCHEHGGHHDHGCDCACYCCIRCADVVEYARCGETRRIPITFENDTRRQRDVKLTLGNFATEGGQDLGWAAAVSDSEFQLGPCGEKTVLVAVRVDCSKFGDGKQGGGTTSEPKAAGTSDAAGATPSTSATVLAATAVAERTGGTVDRCRVAYATLSAEGCTIRPMVIAIAVLPEFCGAHHAGCGCGCCCN